jgi:hypothetical protein
MTRLPVSHSTFIVAPFKAAKFYATGQPSVNYVDTNVVGGTKYWYYVTAVLNGDESAGSNEVSATIPNNPPPPSGLTITSVK